MNIFASSFYGFSKLLASFILVKTLQIYQTENFLRLKYFLTQESALNSINSLHTTQQPTPTTQLFKLNFSYKQRVLAAIMERERCWVWSSSEDGCYGTSLTYYNRLKYLLTLFGKVSRITILWNRNKQCNTIWFQIIF